MMYNILGMIKDGHSIVGYRLQDESGQIFDASKEQTVKVVEDGLVNGARIYWYNDNPIVKTKEKLQVCARVIKKKEKIEKPVEIKKYTGTEMLLILRKIEKGTPLKITFTSVESYKQCLYMGYKESPCNMPEYYFFDGSGLGGMFKFSERFILNNKNINITLDNNDAELVSKLIQKVKGE